MEDKQVLEALHTPVPPDEIKWRQARYDKPNGYVKMLAYVDARYVMDVLDNIVGSENWENEYIEIKGRIFCKLSIRLPSGKTISKMDCGAETDIEAEKGAVSDALKRVAVLFGIGRDLYSMGDHFAETNDRGYIDKNSWEPPRSVVMPETEVQLPRTEGKEPTTSALAHTSQEGVAADVSPSPPTTEKLVKEGIRPAPKTLPPLGPPDGSKEYVTVPDMVFYRETPKAILVGEPGSAQDERAWIPKSVIEDYDNNPPFKKVHDMGPLEIPRWVADQNNLNYVPF